MPYDELTTMIVIDITYVPQTERNPDSGWCWSVYHNGNQYASEVLPESSRITAEAYALKYVNELLGGSPRKREDHDSVQSN